MKKFLIVIVSLLVGTGSFARDPINIDAKLLQSFNSSFPHATEIKWGESKESYVVTFIDAGIRSRVIYPKDKSYVHLTRYYMQSDVPFGVVYKMKQEYPDKSVYCVVEVSTISEPGSKLLVEYYVKLEDPKTWTTVKMDSNGLLSVVEKFRKAL